MAKKYYLGEQAANRLSNIIPYVERQMRSTKIGNPVGTPLFGGKAFLAKLTSAGPNEEDDFTDPRYWAREITITNNDNEYTSELEFAYPERPNSINIDQWLGITHWVVATNVHEIVANSHDLPTDDSLIIIVHNYSDQTNLPRYVFETPGIVID